MEKPTALQSRRSGLSTLLFTQWKTKQESTVCGFTSIWRSESGDFVEEWHKSENRVYWLGAIGLPIAKRVVGAGCKGYRTFHIGREQAEELERACNCERTVLVAEQ